MWITHISNFVLQFAMLYAMAFVDGKVKNPKRFNTNFFNDWRKCFGETHRVRQLELCGRQEMDYPGSGSFQLISICSGPASAPEIYIVDCTAPCVAVGCGHGEVARLAFYIDMAPLAAVQAQSPSRCSQARSLLFWSIVESRQWMILEHSAGVARPIKNISGIQNKRLNRSIKTP